MIRLADSRGLNIGRQLLARNKDISVLLLPAPVPPILNIPVPYILFSLYPSAEQTQLIAE
jgi:hypothetical protein